MAKERKLTKEEEADIARRKSNRYYSGASDKAMSSGSSQKNVYSESRTGKSDVVGISAAKRRVDEVRKPKGTANDESNAATERLEALRAIGEVDDKKYRKEKKKY